MTKRIPERGTPRYPRYWAERRLLDELHELESALICASVHPDRYGDEEAYRGAIAALTQARALFAVGWAKGRP